MDEVIHDDMEPGTGGLLVTGVSHPLEGGKFSRQLLHSGCVLGYFSIQDVISDGTDSRLNRRSHDVLTAGHSLGDTTVDGSDAFKVGTSSYEVLRGDDVGYSKHPCGYATITHKGIPTFWGEITAYTNTYGCNANTLSYPRVLVGQDVIYSTTEQATGCGSRGDCLAQSLHTNTSTLGSGGDSANHSPRDWTCRCRLKTTTDLVGISLDLCLECFDATGNAKFVRGNGVGNHLRYLIHKARRKTRGLPGDDQSQCLLVRDFTTCSLFERNLNTLRNGGQRLVGLDHIGGDSLGLCRQSLTFVRQFANPRQSLCTFASHLEHTKPTDCNCNRVIRCGSCGFDSLVAIGSLSDAGGIFHAYSLICTADGVLVSGGDVVQVALPDGYGLEDALLVLAFPVGIGVTELADERISGWLDDATLLFVGDLLVVFPHEQERVRVCGVGYEVLESHSGVGNPGTKGNQFIDPALSKSTVLTEQGKLSQSSNELLIRRLF